MKGNQLLNAWFEQGNGAGIKTEGGTNVWVWVQDRGYAVYFNDGNIWRDKSQDKEPLHFDTLEQLLEYLNNN